MVDAADDATRSAVGADSNETKVAFDTANPMRDAMRAAAALRARAKNAVVEEAAATKGMGEKKKSRFLSMRLEARDQAEVAPSKVPPLSPSRATIRERSPARSPVRSPAVRAAPAPNTDDSSSMDENY